jgi:hypothetical protein
VSKKGFLIGENMSERFQDQEPTEPKLNRGVIIEALHKIGIDVVLGDWIEYDANQILGDLAVHAALMNIEMEDLFELCHIEIESFGGNDEV